MNLRTIRIKFSSPEYDEALKIRRDVFINEQNIPENIEIDCHESSCVHFLTFIDSVPAGAGRLYIDDKIIKFQRIAALKIFRGQGVGTHLVETMLDYAKDHFSTLIPFMHSQADAVGFYEKLGWRKSGSLFIEAGIPHQAMIYGERDPSGDTLGHGN